METSEFSGKNAWVIGGTSGIGLAVARELSRRHARVGIMGLPNDANLRQLDTLYESGPGPHCMREVDVANAEQFQDALKDMAQQMGQPEMVLHNVGIDCEGDIADIDVAMWDRVLDVNLRSAYVLLQQVLPVMMAARHGSIVLGSSNAGLVARVQDPVYCASKAGLNMLTRSVALQAASRNVRINAICPGPVFTPSLGDPELALSSTPAHRIAHPEEVASLVVFLLSNEATFITGAAIPIDGGKTAGHLPPRNL